MLKILIVEDEALQRRVLNHALKKYGEVLIATNASEAISIAHFHKIDLAFVDLDLENRLDGFQILAPFKHKNIYTIVLTGNESEECIQEAYERGCNDYYTKGQGMDSIDRLVEKFLTSREESCLDIFLREEFITQDPYTIEQISLLKEVGQFNDPVLILGPTGTGKTMLARKIHTLMKCPGEFVEINCSAIPENLLESELFGHVKGSFTGAITNKEGLLQRADKGTIFLDEIGAIPLALQAKLLKALEEKMFLPVGAVRPVSSDFRIVSATCENLDEYRKSGKFRNDLYYRLSGVNIALRPLRDRAQDINLLINHLLSASTRKIALSKEARSKLNFYTWPGNVRELKKVINILLSKEKGLILSDDLPDYIRNSEIPESKLMTEDIKASALSLGLYETMERIKNEIMKSVSLDNQGKVNKTLLELKISTNTYYKLMRNDLH